MSKKKNKLKKSQLFPNILIFVVVIIVSFLMVKYGIVKQLLGLVDPYVLLPEFIAGMFYSSFFTTPIAIGAFFILGTKTNPLTVALVGGLGAMLADLLILRAIKIMLFGHHFPLSQNAFFVYVVKQIRSTKLFRVFIPLLGALIIASPLPDEIGLMLLGITDLKTWQLAMITYIFNTLGIFIIALTASLLV